MLTRKEKIDLAYTILMTSYYNSGSLGAVIHELLPEAEPDLSYNDRLLLGATQDYLRGMNRLMEAWNTYSALELTTELEEPMSLDGFEEQSVIDELLNEIDENVTIKNHPED